jgi:hypothetical protein
MTFTVVGGHSRPRAVTGLLVVCALLTAGCFRATGGGSIQSAVLVGADRATFGFSVRCRTMQQNGNPVAILYDGQLDWHDGLIRFHGIAFDDLLTLPGSCEDIAQELPGGVLSFGGTYEPHNGGLSGFFTVQMTDAGEPGINGDCIAIQLAGGSYAGYMNAGPLQAGNIQIQVF